MDNASLQSLLKRLCNVLWAANVTNPITYVTQISFLLFLKMLEEMEAEEAGNGKSQRKPIFTKAKAGDTADSSGFGKEVAPPWERLPACSLALTGVPSRLAAAPGARRQRRSLWPAPAGPNPRRSSSSLFFGDGQCTHLSGATRPTPS